MNLLKPVQHTATLYWEWLITRPMEEQRQRYGPPLYSLTTMVLNIRLFLSLLLGRFEASKLWVTLQSFLFTAKIVGCILYLAYVVVFFLNTFWLLFIEQTEASNCYLGRSSWHIYLRVWKIHQISWVLFFDFCFICCYFLYFFWSFFGAEDVSTCGVFFVPSYSSF